MEKSYLITATLLILHQIDAAYWHEWEMVSLPGGIQGFLLFNILAIPLLLIGYKHILKSTATAIKSSYICAGVGLLLFFAHAVFLLLGYEQFRLPLSLAIIGLCLISSIWQISLTMKVKLS